MIKRLLVVVAVILTLFNRSQAQCPLIYDYLGNLSANPQFIYCQSGPYSMNIISTSAFGAYTINWGDGSPNSTGASNAALNPIPHTYAATVNTFVITLTLPSVCTRTYLVVQELPVTAAICIPSLGLTQACAPKTLTFTNCSNSISGATTFTWDFGDGSPPVVFNSSNAGQSVTHTYQKGTVNCETSVNLYALNYCRFNTPSNSIYNPIQIWDVDNQLTIAPDKVTKCWPDNTFTVTIGGVRNCINKGNISQRYEYWNLGDNWGKGVDSIVNWKPWPPTTPVVISYPAIGSYTVMMADSNQCGIIEIVQTLNIVPPPTASIIAPGGVLCQNASMTFTNNSPAGYTYKWNFGTGAGFVNLGNGNKSIIYASPGTYTVKLVAQVTGGGSSCSDTASAVVNILAAPVSSFNYSPATGCNSLAAVGFTDTSTGTINNWSWNFGNGNNFSGQVPPDQSYLTPGNFTASLTVTATTSCVHTRTASIIVRSTPVPNFPVFANCVNAVSNFSSTSTVTGTSAINSYTWNFGDGTPISTSPNPSHTYTAANTYTVKLIVATAFCLDSIKQQISINVKPTANFVFTPTVACPPFVSSFSNTTLNGVNYIWRFGTSPTATSSANNPTFTYINATQNIQNYTVALISVTGAGCSDSIKKVIAVYPEPVASYTTATNAGCSPIIFTFSNTTIGGDTYDWSFGDGGVSTQTNTTHTFTNIALSFITRTVQLIATNPFGCKDTTSQTYQIFPEPFINFTMTPGDGCTPLQVNFSSVPGIITYTWDYGDGSPLSNATNSITHTYTNATNSNLTYTAVLMAANAFGCVDTTYGYPVVYPKPVPAYSLTPSVGCSPLAVTFSNTSIGSATNFWQFGNGQSSSQVNPVTTYTNARGASSQTFTAKLVVTSINNCKDSINKQVKLFDHPQAIFTLDSPACSPKLITFFNTSIYSQGYNWSFGDGNVSSLTDPTNFYVNTATFNQTFPIRLIVTSNDGCKDTLIVPLVVHPKPNFFISSRPDSGCTPLTVRFNNVVGVQLYQWNFGDGNTANIGNVENLFVNNTPADRVFNVQMIATDIYGCKDTALKDIKVFPRPNAFFKADPVQVFIPNQPVQCYNLSSGAVSYVWNFGDGGTSTETSPSHKYTQKGDYVIGLLATSNKGCTDTFNLPGKIVALDETFVQMPNAFTPNPNGSPGPLYDPNDINNDVFHPVIRGTEKYVFSIYSRWGELLFETKNPDEGWDGYYKGKACTQDVYVWKIAATFIDGKTFNKTGDVLLLK